MDVRIQCQTKATTSLGAGCLSRGVRGLWAPVSLAPPAGSKPQEEDWGDIDEDEGHLYDQVKMLHEEDYEPSPVFTQRMEDAILIVSYLSPFYVQHEFYYPLTVWLCN